MMAFVTARLPADSGNPVVPGQLEAEADGAAPAKDLLGVLEKTAIAEDRGDHVRVRRTRPAGCFLFGPYWLLPTGCYRLTFRAAARRLRRPEAAVLGVEIIALNRLQQAWRDFTAAELAAGAAALAFTVPPELDLDAGDGARFEFRFFHLGNADLSLSAIALENGDADEEPAAAMRRWRLFGRLRARALGLDRRAHFRVRRWRRPGVVLALGRPPLQLPAGNYRLTFRAAAHRPLRLSQPVLGVAIVAQSRWRDRPLRGGKPASEQQQAWRDFTAAELAHGAAAIDFVVPPERAVETGGETIFDVRFRHFGNAEWTLDALALQLLSAFASTALSEAAPAIDAVLLRAVPSAPPALPELGPAPGPAPGPISGPALGRQARQKVVVVGNCQALAVYEALCRAGRLNARIEARYHFVGLQKNLHEQGRRELQACDVLLVQEIQDWERYPLREAVAERTPIIKFPLLRFASLWPFDHYNGPGDREAYEREWPNLTFPYLDGLLGRLRREIPDREQRFAAYRTLAVAGIVNYVRLHDFETRRLVAMDRKYGCSIGRFILDNFRRRQVFYMTCHPNGQVLTLLMRHLIKQLGIDAPYHPHASLDHFKRQQVPVHPKIAKALGVTWAHEKTRYLYDGRTVTWESYIRSYIDHYG
jgi:hypothetical protein